jgi:hypothetical protein
MKLKLLVEKLQKIIEENPDTDLECWIHQVQTNFNGLQVYSISEISPTYKLWISNRHNIELQVYLDNDNKFETWQKNCENEIDESR